MPRSGFILHLSPSALEISVRIGGRASRIERAELDPADWADLWARHLRPLDAPLTQLLQRAGVRNGSRVDALYQSPETRVELLTVQARAADAVAAAKLSLSQGHGDRPDRPSLARIVVSDTVAGAARTHVLCAADSDMALDSLAQCLTRAGLTPGNLVPAEAVEVLGLAEAFRVRAAGNDASFMLMGEHRTVIAAGEGTGLRCVRTLEFGFAAMIDAMARAARAGSLSSLSPGALRQWAREAIFRVGVPRRDQAVDEQAGIRAEHVLPLLQPVIQRYAVEVKQTLRFAGGNTESGLVRGSLLLIGPGAAIPTLASVLSTQIDIAVTADTDTDRSPLALAAIADRAGLSLLPATEQRRRDRVSFKRAMLVGAGAAAVLIATDAARTFREQYRVQQQIDSHMLRLIEVRRDIDLRQKASEFEARVRAREDAARSCLGSRPDWGALLDELGALGDERIRLTDINAASSGTGHSASISGVAHMPERASGGGGGGGGGAPDPLAAYIERLQHSPMIEGVDLGSTRLGEYEGAPVKHFTLTARLVAMPPRLAGTQENP